MAIAQVSVIVKRACGLWVFVAAWAPQVSLACAVCGITEGKVKDAFIYTTGLLTVVPLIMIGGGAYYLASKFQSDDSDSPKN